MSFVYNRDGLVEDWECRHGYPAQACGVPSEHPQITDLCSQVGVEMMRWYRTLPDQSHVRMAKIWFMERDVVPGYCDEDIRPDLHRLAGL